MILPIYVYGHPVLRKVAEDIEKDYKGLDKLIADMFDTMYNADGIGLAAPQVGKPVRIFVIDGSPLEEDEPDMANFKKVFINAHIVEKEGEVVEMTEGCLSIPNLREEVEREERIRITYHDQDWKLHDEVYEGFLARVIQHEYDHLDGVLFPDKLTPLRRRLLKGKLSDISKGRFEADYRTILPGQR